MGVAVIAVALSFSLTSWSSEFSAIIEIPVLAMFHNREYLGLGGSVALQL